jgi:hypothetical protein
MAKVPGRPGVAANRKSVEETRRKAGKDVKNQNEERISTLSSCDQAFWTFSYEIEA